MLPRKLRKPSIFANSCLFNDMSHHRFNAEKEITLSFLDKRPGLSTVSGLTYYINRMIEQNYIKNAQKIPY